MGGNSKYGTHLNGWPTRKSGWVLPAAALIFVITLIILNLC